MAPITQPTMAQPGARARRQVLDFMRSNGVRSGGARGPGRCARLSAWPAAMLVAPTEATAASFGVTPFAPGSGTGTTGVEADGALEVYPPDADGDVAPETSFADGMYGSFVVVFEPSGDLWAANVDNGTLVEIARAHLATPDPVPAVTISAAGDALEDPYVWLLTIRATFGSSVTMWAGSTSTPSGSWPGRARRRPSPLFRTS
jgi:hypothetical protein